jgi:hypothetical protein
MLSLVFATRWGIGISPDSATYIGAARSFLEGKGLIVPFGKPAPMTHYPPLFPLVLSIAGLFGATLEDGARWLNVLLFGANILLVGWMIQRDRPGAFWLSLFGSLLMLTSIDVLAIHMWAQTEPLFIFFGLLGLGLLAEYFKKPAGFFLAASAGATAMAFLTRYVGIALVAAGIAGILLLSGEAFRKRVRDAAIFFVLSLFPITLWLIRNSIVSPGLANRQMVVHMITLAKIKVGLITISTWILPAKFSGVAGGIFLAAACTGLFGLSAILFIKERRSKTEGGRWNISAAGIPSLMVLFIFFYAALLFVSMSFFDAHTALNSRILAPVYVALVMLILCVLNRILSSAGQSRMAHIVSATLGMIVLVLYVSRGAGWINHVHDSGLGYNSPRWQRSELMRYIRTIPPQSPIFSNAPDALYMMTGRRTLWIPAKVDPGTREISDDYEFELNRMKEQLLQKNGEVVYLKTIRWRWYLPSQEELQKQLPLRVIWESTDGTVYSAG